jgi:short-subunit dehydrogenase
MNLVIGGGGISNEISSLLKCPVIKSKDIEEIKTLLELFPHAKNFIITTGFLDLDNFKNLSINSIENTIKANYIMPMLITRLISEKYGKDATVVYFSSSTSFQTRPKYSIYASSKTALEIFVRTIKKEGLLRTKIVRNSRTDTPMRWKNFKKNEETLSNLLSPSDVALGVQELLSSDFNELEIFKIDEMIVKEFT